MKGGHEPPAFAVKICGITTPDDAALAIEEGADYIGFVFYAGSPRAVGPERAAAILDELQPGVRAVGVFVNESPSTVVRIVKSCRLSAAQLHGNEDAAEFETVEFPVWRAVRLAEDAWHPCAETWKAERFVMDAATPAFGGSGEKTDWAAAAAFAKMHPSFLAGGLTPDNVAEAVCQVSPMGVDVSTGVEAKPGRKDPCKVREFIRNARKAHVARVGA